jgi:hypothetical protein
MGEIYASRRGEGRERGGIFANDKTSDVRIENSEFRNDHGEPLPPVGSSQV